MSFALAALWATGVAAQELAPPAPVQTSTQAIAQDAAEYARAFGVPQDEAERRLRAQGETVAATEQLQLFYRERLAGVSVEHRPGYRIVFLLTGDEPVAPQMLRAGGIDVPVEFHTGAAATQDELVAAIAKNQGAFRALLPHPPGMGVDPRTGELVAVVAAPDVDQFGGAAALARRLQQIALVPVRVRAVDRPGLDLSPEGGGRVAGINPADGRRYACTAGFVVTDGARTGIATAAHCPDQLSYLDPGGRETPLEYVGQWGWGFQDVQVNVSADPLPPTFWADSGKTVQRVVAGQRGVSGTRAGDVVCHRGERTGYSCAEVELVNFAPAGDLCGGACSPTWVTVAGPTCRSGDSGAPVFSGEVAYGLVKGATYRGDGSCAFYFYMATDYLPTGWRLLTGAAEGAVLPTPTPTPTSAAAAPTP